MCFECRVLGALLVPHASAVGVDFLTGASPPAVESGDDAVDVITQLGAVSQLDFTPTVLEIEDKDLRDYAAEVYLEDTLILFALHFSVELVPIKVESDGSCLPHALSRCLVGKELLYDYLRLGLEGELSTHAEFYKSVFQQGMDEETWSAFWRGIVDEARPTNGELTGRWLGPEHIFGFANLLRRPILLLDTQEEMQKADQRCGLFLPLRHARDTPQQWASPLVLGWAGPAKNHFVSLVVPSRSALLATEDADLADRVVRASEELWETIELMMQAMESQRGQETITVEIPPDKRPGDVCLLRDPDTAEEYAVQLPPNKSPGESFEWTVPGRTAMVLTKLKRALVHFYGQNAPALRSKACATMHRALSNLIDALLLGDTDKIAKFSQLPLDNKVVEATVVRMLGALNVLRAVGFEHTTGTNGRPFLRFAGDASRSDVCDGLMVARDALGLMRVNTEAALGGGQVPVERQCEAFGPAPAVGLKWDEAASGFAPVQGFWIFGMGRSAQGNERAVVQSVVQRLKQDFAQISAGTDFEDMPWDDPRLYNSRLKHVRCPRCGRDAEWTGAVDGLSRLETTANCADCNELLLAEHTDQRRMSAYVAGLIQRNQLALCDDHHVLRMSAKACPKCVNAPS